MKFESRIQAVMERLRDLRERAISDPLFWKWPSIAALLGLVIFWGYQLLK